jgi:lipopolysaccharide cholinephosphotransferase
MKFKKEDIVILDENTLCDYQAELLNIAKDVIAVMDKHHINYSLSGGSILGAIRHKGFIPWDDDIDMNIPRQDYERLLEIFDEELGDRYYIQTPQKYPELGLLVTQIRKRGTIARRKYDWNLEECGISIDLYIIENVFDNLIARFFQKTFSMAFSFAVASVRTYNNRNLPEELYQLEGRELNYSKSKHFFGRILRVIPLKYWIMCTELCFSACKSEQTRLVSIPSGRKHFSGEIYRREDMCNFRKAQFESEYFNIPVRAEEYLTNFYGNYMELPPEEKREKHLFLELYFK